MFGFMRYHRNYILFPTAVDVICLVTLSNNRKKKKQSKNNPSQKKPKTQNPTQAALLSWDALLWFYQTQQNTQLICSFKVNGTWLPTHSKRWSLPPNSVASTQCHIFSVLRDVTQRGLEIKEELTTLSTWIYLVIDSFSEIMATTYEYFPTEVKITQWVQ